jgi:hypothetical protein
VGPWGSVSWQGYKPTPCKTKDYSESKTKDSILSRGSGFLALPIQICAPCACSRRRRLPAVTGVTRGEGVKSSGLYNVSKSFNKKCACVGQIRSCCFDSIEFAFHLVIEVTVQALSSPFVELAGRSGRWQPYDHVDWFQQVVS